MMPAYNGPATLVDVLAASRTAYIYRLTKSRVCDGLRPPRDFVKRAAR